MPIYEFHCGKCEADSEILVRSAKWQGTQCPHCGSTKLTKKLSTFASGNLAVSESAPTCEAGGGSCACRCAGGPHRH